MREQAEKDYMAGMKYKDIAEKYGVSINTVKSWKQRYKWDKNRVHTKAEKGAHKKEKVCTQNKTTKKPRGAPKGNKNTIGNKGGEGGPVGNDHAVTHGFFRRIFPDDDETLAIIGEIQVKSPLEILWEQIVIQYTAIARAQRLMFVENRGDKTIEKISEGGGLVGERWEIQQSWDKHANFLTAQSRAIKTLEQLIARYERMLMKTLETEEQELKIDKLRYELDKLKSPDNIDIDSYIESYMNALNDTATEIWEDEGGADK